MTWTIDRLNNLISHYGGKPVQHLDVMGRLHRLLDDIDAQAGLNTTGALITVPFSAVRIPINPIGARIWRHERHISLQLGNDVT